MSEDSITISLRISKKKNPQLYKWVLDIEEGMRSHIIRKGLEQFIGGNNKVDTVPMESKNTSVNSNESEKSVNNNLKGELDDIADLF